MRAAIVALISLAALDPGAATVGEPPAHLTLGSNFDRCAWVRDMVSYALSLADAFGDLKRLDHFELPCQHLSADGQAELRAFIWKHWQSGTPCYATVPDFTLEGAPSVRLHVVRRRSFGPLELVESNEGLDCIWHPPDPEECRRDRRFSTFVGVTRVVFHKGGDDAGTQLPSDAVGDPLVYVLRLIGADGRVDDL
jgi:hypothetical protein